MPIYGGGGGGGGITSPDSNVNHFLSGANTFISIPASALSGQTPNAQGGTGADTSATGGLSNVVKQTSVGGAFTVALLNGADEILGPLVDRTVAYGVEDFFYFNNGATSGALGSYLGIHIANSGTAAANSNFTGHPGVWQLGTGAVSATGASAVWGNGAFCPGDGPFSVDWLVNIPTLSQTGGGNNDYNLQAGFAQNSYADPTTTTYGCVVRYNAATSANWLIATNQNGAWTETASSVPVATGWIHLQTIVNANRSAQLFVGGTEIAPGTVTAGTVTAGAVGVLNPVCSIVSIAAGSTAAKLMQIDRMEFWMTGLVR